MPALAHPKLADPPRAAPLCLTPAEARQVILHGHVRGPLRVTGALDLSGQADLRQLPDDLRCGRLDISDCPNLTSLPAGLHCDELLARNLNLRAIEHAPTVQFRLTLDGCTLLERLPENLRVGSLSVQGCVSLEALPEGLDLYFLNISGCTALGRWPERGRLRFGHLIARDCLNLTTLPAWLEGVAQLDLAGCVGVRALPEGLRIGAWLDLAGSAIEVLPDGLRPPLRWRGVPINARIAFEPETIRGPEVLATENVELRRVLMERMGYGRFLAEVNAEVLDRDLDAGGERSLVRVPIPGDEDFVAVCVRCPSTGRQYVLRVPPSIRSAHAASAWLAGFDDPALYRPVIEA